MKKKDPRCANSESIRSRDLILFPPLSIQPPGPFSICNRSKDGDFRLFNEAGAIVDEWHPVFDPEMSLRVDHLIALDDRLNEMKS